MKNSKIRGYRKEKKSRFPGGASPVGVILLGLIAGCRVVGPDYVSPAVDETVPPAWISPESDRSAPELAAWWTQLNDPVLDTLIETALAGNLDLEQARSRVREARAQRNIQASGRFPTLGGSGAATVGKTGTQASSELYTVGFDAAWEIDLFGSVTRRVEAATADVQAVVEAQRAVRVSLLAELALNYIEYRAFDERIELARENVDVLRKTLAIVQIRHDSGLADPLQLAQAETNLAAEQSRIPPLKTGRDRAAYRLAVLVGRHPGTLTELRTTPKPVPTSPPQIAVGIPADLLRRRPDLRRAERELAAQSARVGVAEADLYPRFSLNGNLQFSSTDGGNLFDSAGRSSSIGPAFQWNIFSAGSVRSQIQVQDERLSQALLRYEQGVLLALEEVEGAMAAHAHGLERRRTLTEAVTAARRAADLAEVLYLDGLKDFLHVLDTQRVLFAAEDQFVLGNAEVAGDLVRLYKALGGGWDVDSEVSE